MAPATLTTPIPPSRASPTVPRLPLRVLLVARLPCPALDLLLRRGHAVVPCHEPAAAPFLLEEWGAEAPFDLVVVGEVGPLDAADVVRGVAGRPGDGGAARPQVQVLVLAERADPARVDALLDAGATDVLVGPPDEAALAARLAVAERRAVALRGRAVAEDRFRLLVERVPAATYVSSPEGDRPYLYVSPQFEALFGYPPGDWLADPGLWERTLHPDDRARALAEDARTDATGEPFCVEYRVFARDGRTVWIRDEAVLVRDGAGRPGYWQGIKTDVTASRQGEAALRESERRYRELLAAEERHRRELELLNHVRSALVDRLDVPTVCRTVVEAVAAVFGYRQVSAYLLVDGELRLQHQVGYPRVLERIPLDRGVAGRVARTGEAVLLEDARADPDFLAAFDGLSSEVCVPLRDDGRVAGVLNLERVGDERLGPDDLRLMLALAQHVDAAITRARLYGEAVAARRTAERRAEHLALLNDVGRALSAALDVEALCAAIHAAVGRVLTVDTFFVALHDAAAGEVWFPYQFDDGRLWPGERTPLGDGPTGRVVRTGRPLLISGLDDLERAGAVRFGSAAHRTCSALFVPVLDGERLVGVLSVQTYADGAYGPEDLRTLETIAAQAAAALVRARLHAEARAGEERFRTAFAAAPVGMALVAPEGRLLMVNRALCQMLGYGEAELLALGVAGFFDPDDLAQERGLVAQLLAGERETVMLKRRFRHRSGDLRWGLVSAAVVRAADGTPLHVVGQVQDITAREALEARLRYLAHHDLLTGLANRAHFLEQLDGALGAPGGSADGGAGGVGVLYLDLDGFKRVNDGLGHGAGDRVLTEVGRRLRACLRAGDLPARYGGDEFTVLVDGLGGAVDLAALAARVAAALAAPHDLGGRTVAVGACVGGALGAPGRHAADDLLREADVALYGAKAAGRGRSAVRVLGERGATSP